MHATIFTCLQQAQVSLFCSLLSAGLLASQHSSDSHLRHHATRTHTEIELMQAGLIPDVLDLYPEATVAGSKVALMYLQGLTHRPFQQKVVKGGDKIDLGGGHVMEFVMAPNLHWPDTMFSFDHATGACPCACHVLLGTAWSVWFMLC